MVASEKEARHQVRMAYEMVACRPRHRFGPASPRCPPSSESTEGRCLTDSHGPEKQPEGAVC